MGAVPSHGTRLLGCGCASKVRAYVNAGLWQKLAIPCIFPVSLLSERLPVSVQSEVLTFAGGGRIEVEGSRTPMPFPVSLRRNGG